MYRINVKEHKDCNWFLIALCAILSLSTVFFAVLSVRNAKPMNCDHTTFYEDGSALCEIVIESKDR